MFLIGLGDDLHPVRPATKLVLQMLAAPRSCWCCCRRFSITGAPTLDLMLGFAWIVGITKRRQPARQTSTASRPASPASPERFPAARRWFG
jgi:hypothetical protein